MSELTKKAIIEAFIKLADTTPIEKISVKQITDMCGINRNTFYYHYEDIYALVKDIVHTKSVKLFNIDLNETSWEDAWIRAAEYTKKNRRFIRNIYDGVGRDTFEEYLLSITDGAIRRSFMEKLSTESLTPIEREAFLFIVKKNFALIAIDWIKSDGSTDPVQLVKDYISFIKVGLPKIVAGALLKNL